MHCGKTNARWTILTLSLTLGHDQPLLPIFSLSCRRQRLHTNKTSRPQDHVSLLPLSFFFIYIHNCTSQPWCRMWQYRWRLQWRPDTCMSSHWIFLQYTWLFFLLMHKTQAPGSMTGARKATVFVRRQALSSNTVVYQSFPTQAGRRWVNTTKTLRSLTLFARGLDPDTFSGFFLQRVFCGRKTSTTTVK